MTSSFRHGARSLAAVVLGLMVLVLVLGQLGSARAQSFGGSYLTPFPPSDRYRAYVFGDSLGPGLAAALARSLAQEGIDVVDRSAPGLGIARGDNQPWDAQIAALPKEEAFQIAVLHFGLDDRTWLRIDKRRYDMSAPQWRQEYARRVDALIKALRKRGIAIYWLGLPIMRPTAAASAAQLVNSVFLESARLNGVKFLDTWDSFADGSGAYTDFGADLTGKLRQLREPNGIGLTARGFQKLASFAEREILRDLTIARSERDVPLAGDADEQERVRQEAERRQGNRAVSQAGTRAAALGGQTGQAPAPDANDVPASTSKITVQGTSGEAVALEIVRPAIPGAVLTQLLNSGAKRQSDIGSTLSADLVGGLTVLTSVTTSPDSVQAGGNRQPVTQSPYFKLLIRGDPLPAKPGRADDFRWPRPEASPAG